MSMHVHSVDRASIRAVDATTLALSIDALGQPFFWQRWDCAHRARRPSAADQKAILAKIKGYYQSAAAAYDDGDLDKTQAELQQALKLAEENGVELRTSWSPRSTSSTASSRSPVSRTGIKG